MSKPTQQSSQLESAQASNNASNKPAGEAIQSCEKKQCDVNNLVVNCDHGSRGYSLELVEGPPPKENPDYLYEVISKSSELEKMTVNFTGSCANDSASCPSVALSGAKSLSQLSSGAVFSVKHKDLPEGKLAFPKFVKEYLLPYTLKPNVYKVQTQGCNGSGDFAATINVYPAYKLSGTLTVDFEPTKQTNGNYGWKFSGQLKLDIDSQSWTYGEDLSQKEFLPQLQESLNSIVTKIKEITDKTKEQSGSLIKFSPAWPKISLGGELELKEMQAGHRVSSAGNLSLKFEPLLGFKLETDILDWLILTSGTAAPFLQKIRDQAAKGIDREDVKAKMLVGIILSINGDIGGELKWSKSASDKVFSTSGDKSSSVAGQIGINLNAKVEVETEVKTIIFYVKITVGAALQLKGASKTKGADGKLSDNSDNGFVGIKASLTATTEEDKPAIGGSVKFTGAAIYYTYYAEVGGKGMENKDIDSQENHGFINKGSKRNNTVKENSNSKLKEENMKQLVEIFSAREWPKNNAKHSIQLQNSISD